MSVSSPTLCMARSASPAKGRMRIDPRCLHQSIIGPDASAHYGEVCIGGARAPVSDLLEEGRLLRRRALHHVVGKTVERPRIAEIRAHPVSRSKRLTSFGANA